MVVHDILIFVYHVEREFFDDWICINLIARLLINWIAICMYSQMHVEHCSKSPLKIISNGLNERKLLDPHQHLRA